MLQINSKEINDEDMVKLDKRFLILSDEFKLIDIMKEEFITFIKTAN